MSQIVTRFWALSNRRKPLANKHYKAAGTLKSPTIFHEEPTFCCDEIRSQALRFTAALK
jgi:hypothetical protein